MTSSSPGGMHNGVTLLLSLLRNQEVLNYTDEEMQCLWKLSVNALVPRQRSAHRATEEDSSR